VASFAVEQAKSETEFLRAVLEILKIYEVFFIWGIEPTITPSLGVRPLDRNIVYRNKAA